MLSSLLALGIICAHAQASDSQSPKTKTPDNWPEASLDAISERVVVDEHRVNDMAVSPCGNYIATAGDNGIRLWNVHSMKMESQVRLPSNVFCLAFSPDGALIASGDEAATLAVWNSSTLEMIAEKRDAHFQFTPSSRGVLAVAFSSDGQTIASGGYDQQFALRVWDAKSLELREERLRAYGNGIVLSLAFSPAKQWLVCGTSVSLLVFDAKLELLHHVPDKHVKKMSFASDGFRMATGTIDSSIQLWGISDDPSSPIMLLAEVAKACAGPVAALSFSPSGSTLLSGAWDPRLRLWSTIGMTPLQQLNVGQRENNVRGGKGGCMKLMEATASLVLSNGDAVVALNCGQRDGVVVKWTAPFAHEKATNAMDNDTLGGLPDEVAHKNSKINEARDHEEL